MDEVEGAVVPPLVVVAAQNGALGREVLGKVTPLTAGAQQVQDGIDHGAQIGGPRPPAGVDGDVRRDQPPLGASGQVTGIDLASHEPFLLQPVPRLWDSHLAFEADGSNAKRSELR